MSRCSVCDYVEGHGYNGYAYVPRSHTKVRWRTQYNEFQCDDCFNSIKDSQAHWDPPEEGEQEELIQDDILEEIPTVSSVRFE